jgi:hypothetical protein
MAKQISLISEHLQRKKSVSNFESIDVSQYLPITFHLSNSECIILTVKDIWDQNSKIFVNSTEIFNRLRDKRNWIAEYSGIKASFSLEQK